MQRAKKPSARSVSAHLQHIGRAVAVAACLGSFTTAQFLVFATVGAAPAAAATDPVLMAAGDIGCDPTTSTPANCPMNDTAALINSAKPGYVLALGDIQYTDNLPPGSPPTPSMYLQGYDSAWGKIPASVPGVSINPIAGNHDWADPNDTNSSSGATLANYISYFNSKGQLPSGVTASTPWYSFNIPVSGGSWHVIMLDNECGSNGGCGAGSAQETFLRNDLAANPNVCTIAAWHRPRFSSGAIGNRSEYAQFWTDLFNAHASVVMAGSDHDYERFNPQSPAQAASSTGIAQYVVGTGGAFLPGNFGTVQPNSAFRDAAHWGVLKMTLHAGSYDHAFVTTSGSTLDSGTVNCSSPGTAPAVSGLNPTTGPAAGGNSVVISGTNFTGATSVRFGTVAATGLAVNSATQITVTAPAGTAATTVDVTVVTPNGTSITNTSDRYAYQTTQPQVNSVSPPSGPAAGGTSVTISGINLSGATGVKFGTTPAASLTAVSGSQVTAVSPPGTDQTTVDVTVTTPVATSATGANDKFTFGTITTPPTVAAVTPISGPSTGGNSVSITGSSFAGASAVKFGTAAAASFTVSNAGLITAIPPPGTANLLDVGVTNPAGTSGTGVADQYSYTFSNNGYAVSLAATTAAPAVGAAVNLTATASKDVGPTPYGLGIVDVTTGTELLHGGSGTTLSTSVTQASAVSHRYMAYISNANMANAQANSTPIVVTWGGSTTPPAVSGVAPNSGPAAGGTVVTITGTNFTGASAVKFGATNASFTVGSATSISATAPGGAAGAVDVTVTTPAGTSATSAADQFTYAPAVPAPTVTGVSPASGSTAGGTSVVIAGTGFTGATGVKFGSAPATAFTVNSATSVTAAAPAGAAGTVDITVTTAGGTSAVTAADHFTFVPPVPTVTGVSPASGSTAGGTSVVITGTGFTGVSAVKFGTAPAATFTLNSATQITATAPSAGAGPVDVAVTTPGGTSATGAADVFTYVTPAPVVSGLSPASGTTAGGTSVVIAGSNFSGATGVSFGAAAAASFTVNNAGQITAVSPAGAPGPVHVTVTNLGGTSPAGAADVFTFVTPPPAVTGVSPNSGPAGGGTSVVITGTNFTGATGVSFGAAAAASFTVNTAGQITAVAPAGSGQVDITVTTAAGTSAVVAADKFTYIPPPSVTGVSPVTGTAAGGTSVLITGASFTGATSVKFGTANAASFTVNNAGQITAVSPSGAPGTVDITVTTPAGTSATTGADQFMFVTPPPAVASVTPNTGPLAGATAVTITGSNFTPGTPVVSFGTTAGSVTAFSATSITVTAPAGAAGTVDVLVTTPGGTSPVTAADRFTYADVTGPPTVSGVTPIYGPSTGGTSVVISGTNFASVSSVQFGSVAATSFTVNSTSQITATAPAGTTTVDITVVTSRGTSARNTAGDQFTSTFSNNGYAVSLAATTTAPAVGAAVNITVTANKDVGPTPYGLSIIDVTTGVEVFHGGSGASGSVAITQTTAGPHRYVGFVSNANGANAQAASVPVVVFWGGTLPTVSGVSPATGSTAGGASVVITGTNLTGATAVRFGATNATAFTVNSATSITATAPAAAAGAVDITVTTPTGTSAVVVADQFTYQTPAGPPTVGGVAPAQGPLAGGIVVTITGTGFTGASAVAFGANPAASFSVASPTSITATAPAGSAGTVHISVTNGIGTSAAVAADQFTYLAAPAVTGVAPTSGPAGGGTSVVITGSAFTGATTVKFGAVNATAVTVNNAGQITATSPAGAAAGPVHVTVTTPGGTSSAGAGDQFTYVQAAPAVTSVSPATGSTGGGTVVTITGTNFTPGTPTVAFGANAGAVTAFSATSITVTAPAGAAGQVHVVVTAPAGSSPTGTSDLFTYATGNPGPPTVGGTSPLSGPSAGGTSVVITGTNFLNATSVQFGSVNATSYTVNSPTQITATAPAGTTTVDVTVITPQGTSAHGALDEYTYTFSNNGYSITLSASTTSPAAGGSVVLTATANKDVGPTPYGISIFDVTAGTELVHVGSGASATATVSNVVSTHRYVAMVSNGAGANAQTASTPVVVTWR
jgi:hypothetical protein